MPTSSPITSDRVIFVARKIHVLAIITPLRITAQAFALCGFLSLTLCTCEVINPDEQIPAFLQIDTFTLTTTTGQGYAVHDLTDAWVYVDEQLVGVYEIPASVPILSEGATNIRIEPGVRVSGLVGQRASNVFMRDLVTTVNLVPDSHVVVNPAIVYEDWVNFKWVEDFDDVGISISVTDVSQGEVTRIGGADAYEGNSLKLSIDADSDIFECSTDLAYGLPDAAAPVFLEFTYRNNNSLYVGLISGTPSGVRQTSVLVLNPTDEWKHVYVNLTPTVSSSTLINSIGHQVFFGFLRDSGLEGEAYAIIDNIKLMH